MWVGNTLPLKPLQKRQLRKLKKQPHLMEQTLVYTKTSTPMSRCCSNPSQKRNPNPNFIHKESMPTFGFGNHEEDDIEDEESEFKMGRLIRQASLNSSHVEVPQQMTKVMRGSSSLPRYLSQKPETNQEKVSSMRKLESMKERSRSKNSMKMVKNNSGAPTIPGGWVDKGSSEDMKAQIKFWARAVAFNVHQEC